jgi:hypothetical protein
VSSSLSSAIIDVAVFCEKYDSLRVATLAANASSDSKSTDSASLVSFST